MEPMLQLCMMPHCGQGAEGKCVGVLADPCACEKDPNALTALILRPHTAPAAISGSP